MTILLVELRRLVVLDECVSLLHRGSSMAMAVTGTRLAVVIMRVVMVVTVVGMLFGAHYNERNSFN